MVGGELRPVVSWTGGPGTSHVAGSQKCQLRLPAKPCPRNLKFQAAPTCGIRIFGHGEDLQFHRQYRRWDAPYRSNGSYSVVGQHRSRVYGRRHPRKFYSCLRYAVSVVVRYPKTIQAGNMEDHKGASETTDGDATGSSPDSRSTWESGLTCAGLQRLRM
jgi:hypothetical protein